jgi:hypothetical protein
MKSTKIEWKGRGKTVKDIIKREGKRGRESYERWRESGKRK